VTCQPKAGAAVVVPLPAEIDLVNREQLYDQIYAAFVSGAPVVVVDFSATRFCDGSSLQRLLAVQRRAAAYASQLRLVIPPGSAVRRVADLLALDQQPLIYPSTREALVWAPPPRRAAWLPRPRPARGEVVRQVGLDEAIDEGPGDRHAGEGAVDDRPAQRVQRGVDVETGRELAGGYTALQHAALAVALGAEVALGEDTGHLPVVLGLADERQQHLSGRVLEKAREAAQVPARALHG
jgi:anti-anti-sigma regulatory factor